MANDQETSTVHSLKTTAELLETDPEYAKTLGINAQGIAYLHGAADATAGTAD